MSMNVFFKKSFTAAGKITKFLLAAALTVCCTAPMSLDASAAEGNEIKLSASGSDAVLEVYFPQAAAEEIASMQVSVWVNAETDGVNLEFIPDSGLASKIAESRYRPDTGVLNIYIAGTEALFSPYSATRVGTVRISTSGSGSASATVEVVKNSVKFVREGELVSPNADYPSSVKLTAAAHSSPDIQYPVYPDTPDTPNSPNSPDTPNYPNSPSYPNSPNYPSTPSTPSTPSYPSTPTYPNYFPNISVNVPEVDDSGYIDNGNESDDSNETYEMWGDDNDDNAVYDDVYDDGTDGGMYDDEEPAEQEQVGENFNPPDKSALLDAIARADGYKKADYTESSYNALKEAADRARAVAADTNASQDEVDEALLELENAVGMLMPINDIPSGAEGYGGESGADFGGGINGGISGDASVGGAAGEQPSAGENGGVNNGNGGVQGAEGGNIVNASDGVQPVSGDPFTESGDESPKSFVLKAVILGVVAAAAAAAIIVLKFAKKKKSGGERFKN